MPSYIGILPAACPAFVTAKEKITAGLFPVSRKRNHRLKNKVMVGVKDDIIIVKPIIKKTQADRKRSTQ